MPGASAIGKFAPSPIRSVQNAAAAAVAEAAASNGMPADARIDGLANRMYAIVRNVATPPRISRAVVVPRPWRSKCIVTSPRHQRGISSVGASPRSPEWFSRFHELNRNFRDEALDPLRHFEHAGLFRDRVPEHNPTFVDAERDRVEDVFRAVQRPIGFLLLAADDHVDVRVLNRGGRIAYAKLNSADLGVGIADDSQRARPGARFHARSQSCQRGLGND